MRWWLLCLFLPLFGCEGAGPKATKLLPDTKELTNAVWDNATKGINNSIDNDKPNGKR